MERRTTSTIILTLIATAVFAAPAAAKTAVAVTVGCSPATVRINQPTTCTATVADTGGGPVPTGTVNFINGASPPQRDFCFLSAGSCSIQYTPATAGEAANRVTANYAADANHLDGSGATTVAVTPHGTSLTVKCAPAEVITGLPTICTGTVANTDPDAGSLDGPRGPLTFSGTGFNTQTCPMDTDFHGGGTCQVMIHVTLPGANVITARFDGNVNFAAASGTTTVTATGPAKSGGGGGAQNVLLACAKASVRLIAAYPVGEHQTRVEGIALTKYAGTFITISSNKHTLGHAKVAADGSFTVKVRRGNGVYVAAVGGHRSRPLGLTGHLILEPPTVASGKVEIGGRLVAAKNGKRDVTVTRLTDCTLSKRAGVDTTDGQGRFAVKVVAPSAADGTVVFRVKVVTATSILTQSVLVHR